MSQQLASAPATGGEVSNDSIRAGIQMGVDPQALLDAHVVLLNNYVRKHHVVSYQALAKRVRKLTILLSTPMEPDRDWDAEWGDLDVRVQKNWMWTAKWKHSAGFKEDNFIHVPIDTSKQLKQLQPDIVLSYEMGMRTILSGWYRRFHRDVPLVMVGNMSQHIEQERGLLRRTARKFVRRLADYFTYNGPSCKRYLESLGIPADKLFHVPYCIDRDVVYEQPRAPIDPDRPRRLLYCGSISERKGVEPFLKQLVAWLEQHPDQHVEFQLAGTGDQQERLLSFERDNLKLKFLGMLDPAGLRAAHQTADIGVLPTFADEWGLTTIEALASGIPVLGSWYAQSVEAVVEDGVNGWVFKPDHPETMDQAIAQAMSLTAEQLDAMVPVCRQSVAHISPQATAEKICQLIHAALPHKFA